MSDYTDFDPYGDSGQNFFAFYGGTDANSVLTSERLSSDPTNGIAPNFFVVEFGAEGAESLTQARSSGERFCNPNLIMQNGPDSYVGLWFHRTVDAKWTDPKTGKPKALNLYFRLRFLYAKHLRSLSFQAPESFPNPFHPSVTAKWSQVDGTDLDLQEIRRRLDKAGLWRGFGVAPEHSTAGGRSEAQNAAFAEFQQIIRFRRQQDAFDRAGQVVSLADSGADTAHIAEILNIAPDSVAKTVRRSRERLSQ